MDPTTVIAALAFLLAAGSLGWQISSQRIRLKLEVDEATSEFYTATISPRSSSAEGRPPERPCTVIRLTLSVANVSRRPNTVTRIHVQRPAARDLPSVDGRVPTYEPRKAPINWHKMDEWSFPQALPAGDQHQAKLFFVLADGVWDKAIPLAVEVRAIDAYGKAHRCKAKLGHRADAENGDHTSKRRGVRRKIQLSL